MATPNKLRLLNAWFCPYAQRAWIACEAKFGSGNYELVNAMEIAEDQISYIKDKELTDATPRGLVPVLIHHANNNNKKEIVYESLVCVEYIDEQFEGPKLLPGSPGDRARSRIWADFCNKQIVASFYQLLVKKLPDEREKAAKHMLDSIAEFSAQIEGPFFLGETPSFVDISLAPWMVGRRSVLKRFRNFTIPDTPAYAKFNRWQQAVSEWDSFKATVVDEEKLIKSYQRYADATAKSKVADAVRNGSAMP